VIDFTTPSVLGQTLKLAFGAGKKNMVWGNQRAWYRRGIGSRAADGGRKAKIGFSLRRELFSMGST